jgi:hypothetical protein
MKMTKLLFEFEFDEEDLGEGWFNIYNLELILFSPQHTKSELLRVREVKVSTVGEILPKDEE